MADYQEVKGGKVSKLLNVYYFAKRYWYWIAVAVFLIPSLIGTVRLAYQSENPTLPFVLFATEVFSADQILDYKVDMLSQGNLTGVVGMEKPVGEGSHIWKSVVYYWKWFWNVPYAIVGLIWIIFLPAVIIYKIVKSRNSAEVYKNVWTTSWIFFIYLFVVNIIFMIYNLATGSPLPIVPEGTDSSKGFLLVLLDLVPFHGVGKLVVYVVRWILGIAPPFI